MVQTVPGPGRSGSASQRKEALESKAGISRWPRGEPKQGLGPHLNALAAQLEPQRVWESRPIHPQEPISKDSVCHAQGPKESGDHVQKKRCDILKSDMNKSIS